MSEIEKGSQVAPTNPEKRIAELEADNERLVKHIKRANDMAKRSGEYAMQVGEYRDEAWVERDRLRVKIRELERWRKAVLDLCEASDLRASAVSTKALSAEIRDLPLEEF